MSWPLPEGRLESLLEEKAPLYSRGEALAEAERCLYCEDAPCVQKCPTVIDIPGFIRKIATDNVRGAARTILSANLLGESCARVCPVEVLCAGDCVYGPWGRRPIAIGRLQRYATETALRQDPPLIARKRKASTGRRIALVGAGPASLAAAGHLALEGHRAEIFEAKALPGGLNTLGVAPYKLHAEDALREIDFILGLGDVILHEGVRVVAGAAQEGEVSAASLLEDYDAVFLGLGLGPDRRLGIPGEEGPGVYGATALIERIKIDPALTLEALRRVAVVGGGNTAIDVARELRLLGVDEVTMVYRKDAAAMSGYRHEMDAARTEGVRLLPWRQPSEVVREDGRVVALRVEGSGDESGVRETLPCDAVALAIGQSRATQLAAAFAGVALDERGRVLVEPATCRTGNAKVYAGGDCVNGGKEVVNAAQHGKLAARAITRALEPDSGRA